MSDNNVRKYGISDFFMNYFVNFGKILLANLFFCLPLALLIGLAVMLTNALGVLNWFLVFLIIPLMSPFTAGLVNVCRKLTADRTIRPVRDFFKGIKDNWLFFLINSILMYALTAGMFVMIAINREAGGSGPVLVYMIIVLITSIVFLLMDFSAMVMAVTVEISFIDIIKNSLVLISKGIVNHLKIFFALMFTAFLLYSLAAVIQHPTANLIVAGVLMLLSLPTILLYTITYNSYQTIEKHIILPYSTEMQHEKRLQEEKKKDEELTLADLEPLADGDPEEYVFLNGKTVKRKTILKMIEVRKNGTAQNSSDNVIS